MGKLRIVCVCSAKNVLSEDIAVILLCTALYFHTKSSHALYVQNKRVTSMFFNVLFYMGIVRTVWVNISENARWKTGVLTEDSFKHVFQRYIILLASVFYMGKMRTVCVCITEYARWKMGILSKDIAAILLCTAPYLHPKSSHTLYVQYKRVSTMFFNAIIYFLQVYFTWEKCVQCALHCREYALKDECFIRRYRSDPAMYSTNPAP